MTGKLKFSRAFVIAMVLAAIATFTFPFAILLPLFTFEPSFGDVILDEMYRELDPSAMGPKVYSVLEGIGVLFRDGDLVVAFVLLGFSVFFPAIKLFLLWQVLLFPGKNYLIVVRRLEMLGPWSMADVFVVSVMLLAFKSFPGGTTFAINAGYYVFLVSIIASLAAAFALSASSSAPSEEPEGATGH